MSTYRKYGEYAQAENLNQCGRAGLGVGFALLGVAVGAAVALLLAPKSGEQMRDTLRSRGGDLIDSVRGKVMPFRCGAQKT